MTKFRNFTSFHRCGVESEVYKNTPHDKAVEKPIETIVNVYMKAQKEGFDAAKHEQNEKAMAPAIDELIKMALGNMLKKAEADLENAKTKSEDTTKKSITKENTAPENITPKVRTTQIKRQSSSMSVAALMMNERTGRNY